MTRGHYSPVPSTLLQSVIDFCTPQQELAERVTLEHPALDVMTDLRRISAVVIQPTDTVDEAQRRMIQRGVRLLLVLDHERKVTGLITATDVLGEKPMRVVAQRGCERSEVLVSDIMTPYQRLEVLDMEAVCAARVGHIVATLKAAGRQHAMVVERGGEGRLAVRGLFSATQIARQLGVTIHTTEVARTFSEIEAQLAA